MISAAQRLQGDIENILEMAKDDVDAALWHFTQSRALSASELRSAIDNIKVAINLMEAVMYRFSLVCPKCNKASETTAATRDNPRVNCGDCLMDHIEVVEFKVIKVEEVNQRKETP